MDEHDEVRGRRRNITLTDEQLEMIADMAAEKAVAKITAQAYQEVGKTVVKKFTYIVGVLVVAGYFWAQQKGFIK